MFWAAIIQREYAFAVGLVGEGETAKLIGLISIVREVVYNRVQLFSNNEIVCHAMISLCYTDSSGHVLRSDTGFSIADVIVGFKTRNDAERFIITRYALWNNG